MRCSNSTLENPRGGGVNIFILPESIYRGVENTTVLFLHGVLYPVMYQKNRFKVEPFMDDTTHLEKRISDLELHIAHQETAIHDLSDMTAQQWEIIDALKKKMKQLMEHVRAIEDAAKSGSSHEPPPPHY